MPDDLGKRLDDMDDWKDALLGALAIESPERLAFRPDGNGWCALDVVQHLVLVEEGVLGYARKKLLAPPQPVGLRDRARLALLVALLRSPVRVKAPAPQVVPSETLPLAASSERWAKARQGLREILGGLPAERLRSLFFRHPIAGPLDPAGTLRFLQEHALHHDAQVRRLFRAPDCPR